MWTAESSSHVFCWYSYTAMLSNHSPCWFVKLFYLLHSLIKALLWVWCISLWKNHVAHVINFPFSWPICNNLLVLNYVYFYIGKWSRYRNGLVYKTLTYQHLIVGIPLHSTRNLASCQLYFVSFLEGLSLYAVDVQSSQDDQLKHSFSDEYWPILHKFHPRTFVQT